MKEKSEAELIKQRDEVDREIALHKKVVTILEAAGVPTLNELAKREPSHEIFREIVEFEKARHVRDRDRFSPTKGKA